MKPLSVKDRDGDSLRLQLIEDSEDGRRPGHVWIEMGSAHAIGEAVLIEDPADLVTLADWLMRAAKALI